MPSLQQITSHPRPFLALPQQDNSTVFSPIALCQYSKATLLKCKTYRFVTP